METLLPQVKERLEKAWAEETAKRERLAKLEVAVTAATHQITAALASTREFLEATEQHLKVDLACLCCLGPLVEPQVLVPCGHSLCLKCSNALEAGATVGPDGAAKYATRRQGAPIRRPS